jgi:DNA-binding IscR family transcriptional regulator
LRPTALAAPGTVTFSTGKISLLDILEAVDGPIRGQAPLAAEDDGPLNRKLEAICQQSADQVREHLKKVNLSELVAGKGRKSRKQADRG